MATSNCLQCSTEFSTGRVGSKHFCPDCDSRYIQCNSCGEIKSLQLFHKNRSRRNGRDSKCKECAASAKLQLRYGITQLEWNALADKQGNACAICQDPTKPLHLDHCHTSGKNRALLCSNCNTAIGLFGEEVELLLKAVAYIELHK